MTKKSFFVGKLCMALTGGLLLAGCGVGPYIDTLPPRLVNAVVRDAAPNQLVLTFSEAVMADRADGWSLTGATIKGSPSGFGTWTWTFTLSADVSSGQTLSIAYDASLGSTCDSAGNALEHIVARVVTNYVGQPGGGSSDGGSTNPFVGAWTGYDGVVTITDSTWELAGGVKGTYTRNGNAATLATTHSWSYSGWEPITGIPLYSATVSGTTLVVVYDGDTMTFTKSSGGSSSNPFVGTWTGYGGALTITNSTWELDRTVKGTYTRSGNKASLATTHSRVYYYEYWEPITGAPLHAATVSGNTLTVIYYNETLIYTKKSGSSTGSYAYGASTISANR